MEDRIYAAGKGEEFQKAYRAFQASQKDQEAQNIFYEALTNLGASDEEADEYVSLCAEEY